MGQQSVYQSSHSRCSYEHTCTSHSSIYTIQIHIHIVCTWVDNLYISHLAPDAPMNINARYICLYIQYIFIYTHCVYMGQQSVHQSSHPRCFYGYTCTLHSSIYTTHIHIHIVCTWVDNLYQSSRSRCSYEYKCTLHLSIYTTHIHIYTLCVHGSTICMSVVTL